MKGDQETIFRLGAKSLALLINLKESKHLQASYQVKHAQFSSKQKKNTHTHKTHVCFFIFLKIFVKWFEFCFEFEQILLTKNNVIYYAVMFTKNLLNEVTFCFVKFLGLIVLASRLGFILKVWNQGGGLIQTSQFL